MFSKQTIFVLGAGASYELNFPLGADLTRRVADAMNAETSELLVSLGISIDSTKTKFQEAAARLHKTLKTFDSVDEALHWLSGDPVAVALGKVAIASEIMKAERDCKLKPTKGRPDLQLADDTWLPVLLSMMVGGLRKADAGQIPNHITIINFNYDRSLEHYLYWAFQERASMEEPQALQLVQALNIIRPYGGLGDLWGEPDSHPFAGDADPMTRGAQIQTFTEQQLDSTRPKIVGALQDASVIVFLGFGFHTQNIDALAIPEEHRKTRHVFATVRGIAHWNHGLLQTRIRDAAKLDNSSNVQLIDNTARGFLLDLKPSILSAAN